MHEAEKLWKLWTDTAEMSSLTVQCYKQQPEPGLSLGLARIVNSKNCTQGSATYKGKAEEDLT